MRNLSYQKILNFSFCFLIMAGGVLTIANVKPISKAVAVTMKEKYMDSQSAEQLVIGAKEGLESGITSSIFAKETYIDWYGKVEKVLGRHYIRDANPSDIVVKDNHDCLQFITFKTDLSKKAEALVKVKEKLNSLKIPLIFVQAPLKVIEGYTELPDSVADYSNSNANQLLKILDCEGIDYIDLRKEAKEARLDKSKLFFKTDHHWRTETAFWAAGKVTEKLEDYGIVLDKDHFYTDLKNYKLTVFEGSFLGSQGRRVGRYYAGVDNYTLITPLFDTKFNVTILKSDSSDERAGTFEEAIIHKDLLDVSKRVYTNRYAAYFGADYPEVIIQNEMAQSDKKLLIIKDSFALPMSAFLSTMTKETRMLDLRYYKGTVEQYIEEYRPDAVLYVYKSLNTQE